MSTATTSHDELATVLAQYLSAQTGRQVEITELRRVSDGWESDVYAFDAPAFASENGVSNLILRLYFGADAAAKALHEFRSLELLGRAGYPVPRVQLVEPSPQPLGRAFLIMERVGSGSLGKRWRDPDPAVREREMRRFCSLFAQLHTLTWQHLPGAEHVPALTIAQQLDFWRSVGQQFSIEMIPRALSWLEAAAAAISPQPLGLVHWDFHHENILVGDAGQAWVIDWTQFQATDIRFDVAWTLVLLASERDAETAKAARAGYYAERGWEETVVAADMRFFEAAACAKRLVSVLVSLGNGADALGMRPGAETIMAGRMARIALVYDRWLELTATPLPDVEQMIAAHR